MVVLKFLMVLQQGLAILKASLQSKTVLTVFLGDKKAAPLRA
jgi:hypothetical protein